jgi:carboxyl-terminal processing protease
MLPPTPPDEPTGSAPLEPPAADPAAAASAPVEPAPVVPVRASPGSARPAGPLLAVALVVIAVFAGGGLFGAGYLLGAGQAAEPGTPVTEAEAFEPFWDVYRAIRDRYALEPVERKTLIEGAIRGMVEAIGDPYSSYLTADEFRDSLQGISGQFEGIGAEIGTVDATGQTTDCSTFGPDCRLVVVAPLDGSPAEKAGLRPGDIIVAVDGSTLDGLSPDQARDRIRGKKGTVVVLSIERDGGQPFEVSITRDVIVQRDVITRDLAGGSVAYVRLTGFSEGGADQFVEAVGEAVERGVTKLVIDLRGNPGGFIDAARKVASVFIAEGPVFWQVDADGVETETQALGDGAATDPDIEVVLLIDRGSASASEIVAGALQDTGRATLVGETTFGKGTVQQWIELDNDTGGVRLTTSRWLTPDKRWIHRVGIEPDVTVDVPADTPPDADPVLDRALELLGASTSDVRSLRLAA